MLLFLLAVLGVISWKAFFIIWFFIGKGDD